MAFFTPDGAKRGVDHIYMLQQYHTNAEAGEYLGVTGPTYKRLTDCADLMRVADLQKLAAIIPEEQKESIDRIQKAGGSKQP